MSDKVRGSLFGALGDVSRLEVLDAFAGSGALSFEALSRGAQSAVAVDVDNHAYRTMLLNQKQLGLKDRLKVTRANASSWSDNNQSKLFDVVLLDPPYDDVKPALLEKLARHVKVGGVCVVSLAPQLDFSLSPTIYKQLSTKNYGDAQLVFYRRTQ